MNKCNRQKGVCTNLITGNSLEFTYAEAERGHNTKGYPCWILHDVRISWNQKFSTIFNYKSLFIPCIMKGNRRSALFRVGLEEDDYSTKFYIVEHTPLEMAEIIEEYKNESAH